MNRIAITTLALVSAAASLGALAGPAQADPSPNSAVKCFSSGEGAVCEADGNNAHLVSTGDADTTSFAGVYINAQRLSGRSLDEVDYGFAWSGSITGGAPRFNIAVDTDGDGAADGYAVIDAPNCGGVSGGSGVVSTESDACHVYSLGLSGASPTGYADWDAFAAAHPTWTIARDASFVIVDQASDVQLSDISFLMG